MPGQHRCEPRLTRLVSVNANWMKIRNRDYSQWAGREELFERERGSNPDLTVWDECVLHVRSDSQPLDHRPVEPRLGLQR